MGKVPLVDMRCILKTLLMKYLLLIQMFCKSVTCFQWQKLFFVIFQEDDENASYPELQCDLCDKSFSTPAEWVRHIQDTHTEFELSLSNRKNQAENKEAQKNKKTVKKYKVLMKN